MNDIINYFTKSLSNSTLSLKKKGILVEKPWTLLDDDGEIQKLIFKRNKGLILSKNGAVTEGSWDYYPEARALLINRGKDKLLLQEQYVDSNVLILKKDGTANDFFALANENTLPDLNILKYLHNLKIKELKIKEKKLLNGDVLQIHDAERISTLDEYNGHKIEKSNKNWIATDLADGSYLTYDKKQTIFVENQKIVAIKENQLVQFRNNKVIEIIDGDSGYFWSNKNKSVTINGHPISDQRFIDDDNVIYEIKESKIAAFYFIFEYELKNGYRIQIRQKDGTRISEGDVIDDSEPISPLPDGTYKIKGKWRKIKVADSVIV